MKVVELLQSLADKQVPSAPSAIPEALMLARLAQSEQLREFFIQMWLQNPAMARQAGARVRDMLLPLANVPSAVRSAMATQGGDISCV